MQYNYVYRITNKENNKHYYGVRSSKIEPKLDLGIKYFSSSRDKEFMNEQKINKDKFKYKVIKIFETREEAINLEIKLHNKFDVSKNSNFYNKSKQLISSFDTSGAVPWNKNKICENLRKPKSESMRKKLSQTLTGKKHSAERVKINSESKKGFKHINNGEKGIMVKVEVLDEYLSNGWNLGRMPFSEEHKENIRISQQKLANTSKKIGHKHTEESRKKISESTKGRIPWNKGLPMSDEQKKKLSEVNVGKKASNETRLKQSLSRTGKKHTEESKKKISDAKKKKN